MKVSALSHNGRWLDWQRATAIMLFLLCAMFALGSGRAFAAAPAAGEIIKNEATATYNDAAGNPQPQVRSNAVETKVAQIASFVLTASQTKTSNAGTQVYFKHTLQNTGNGPDKFDLSAINVASGDNFDFTSIRILNDNAGTPGTTVISDTGIVAANGTFEFWVEVIAPNGAVPPQFGQVTVTAQGNAATAAAGATAGAYTAAAAASNTDRVDVTDKAVVTLVKLISASSGIPGPTQYTVTLRYQNTSLTTAANTLVITDVLPSQMTYVAGSGVWSIGTLGLTDATGDTQGTAPTIAYDFNSGSKTVTATINNVPANSVADVSFKVTITAGSAAGQFTNTANATYTDAPTGGTSRNATASENFTVTQVAAVVLDDIGSGTDSDGNNDQVTIASATQGAIINFENVIHNNGNAPDTFEIDIISNNFPATQTEILSASGTTLPDADNDGKPEVGPIAAGGTAKVLIRVRLNGTASGNNGGAGWSIVKRATSVFDPTKSDNTTDKLNAITANAVDLTNDVSVATAAAADGLGATNTTVIRTQTVNPGTNATFRLVLNNTGPVADAYNLSTTAALPSGWSVSFKADGGAGNCSTVGADVTMPLSVNNGANRLVCAVVSVPATAAPGNTDIGFRALSPTSGAADIITDRVTVNTLRNVTFTPTPQNNTGFPNSTVVYTHVIANNGNVTEQFTFPTGFITNSLPAWNAALFVDNGDNTFNSATDTQVVAGTTTFTLLAGETKTVFVRVNVPLGANNGDVNATSVTATNTNTTGTPIAAQTRSVVDNTTVQTGTLTLLKEQALDTACTNTPGAFTQSQISAKPGECIRYRITASVTGSAGVQAVIVSDTLPAFTVYNTGVQCFPTPAPAGTAGATTTRGSVTTVPANCASGSVVVNAGNMAPTETAVINFGVQVQK
jgi:trimeric autotransporter adhesin